MVLYAENRTVPQARCLERAIYIMYRLFPSSRAIGENLTDVIGAPRHHISAYNNRYVVNLR